MTKRFCCLLLLLVSLDQFTSLKVHVSTWNVNDNKKMGDVIPQYLMRRLLGIDDNANQMADIYAVSLQENCYMCNTRNMRILTTAFLEELQKVSNNAYEAKGHKMTRDSNFCESLCNVPVTHGTTVIMVFTKRGLAQSYSTVRKNKCMTGLFRNAEKGVAGVKVNLASGKSICFAGVHLDNKNPSTRRSCLRKFMRKASRSSNGWLSCNSIYITGDFNARTDSDSPSDGKTGQVLNPTPENVRQLQEIDEMNGVRPYGGVQLISALPNFVEPEKGDTFIPTYSMLLRTYCGGASHCYREERPMSFADRIVCKACGTTLKYKTIGNDGSSSDHLAVVGLFDLPA